MDECPSHTYNVPSQLDILSNDMTLTRINMQLVINISAKQKSIMTKQNRKIAETISLSATNETHLSLGLHLKQINTVCLSHAEC